MGSDSDPRSWRKQAGRPQPTETYGIAHTGPKSRAPRQKVLSDLAQEITYLFPTSEPTQTTRAKYTYTRRRACRSLSIECPRSLLQSIDSYSEAGASCNVAQ